VVLAVERAVEVAFSSLDERGSVVRAGLRGSVLLSSEAV
jgi:hypothetical protein